MIQGRFNCYWKIGNSVLIGPSENPENFIECFHWSWVVPCKILRFLELGFGRDKSWTAGGVNADSVVWSRAIGPGCGIELLEYFGLCFGTLRGSG